MIKVTILFPRSINEPQGLSRVLKMLTDGRNLFNKHGIELNLISRDTIVGENITYYEDGRVSLYPTFVAKIRRKLMDILDILARHFDILAVYRFNKTTFGWATKALSYYRKLNDNPDVLLFHDIFTCNEYLKTRDSRNTKVMCMVHSIGIPGYFINQQSPSLVGTKFYKKIIQIEDFVMNNVDAYGFVSKSSIKNLLECRPSYNREKLYHVYNGMPDIDISKKVKSSKIEIICVAGLCYQKGQWRIIDALIDVKGKGNSLMLDNLHFTFVGTGDMGSSIKAKIEQHHLSKYVTLVGQSNNVDDFLLKSTIFILPTSNDGLPMAIIEAMRASLPIVSTRIGGIPELIDENVTGIFIEPSKEGVISFISNIYKFDWNKMGRASRNKFLNQFTIDAMVAGYSKVINIITENE